MTRTPPIIFATATLRSLRPHAVVHSAATVDGWMLVGFLTAVVLLTSLTVHQRPAPILGLRAVCHAALGLYAFAVGAWPLGIVLFIFSTIQGYEFRKSIQPSRRRNWSPENRITSIITAGFPDSNSGSITSKPLNNPQHHRENMN